MNEPHTVGEMWEMLTEGVANENKEAYRRMFYMGAAGLLALISDITESDNAEEELDKLYRELRGFIMRVMLMQQRN
jgi:hypothetical protein